MSNLLNALFLRIVQDDDQEAFTKFFDLYYSRMVSFARLFVERQEEAEDIVSDVLVKLLKKKNKVLTVKSIEGYLFYTIKNAALNHLRSQKRQTACIEARQNTYFSSPAPSPEEKYIEEELKQLLYHVVENMPAKRRMVYKLVKDEGLKYKEVADLLEISIKTVENHLDLATKSIRQAVEKYMDDQPQSLSLTYIARMFIVLWI